MFLTKEETATLTGYKQRAKQIEALCLMGVHFFIRPDGWPVVRIEDLGDTHGKKEEEPDFSAL